jgi:HNH endonuclease
VSIVTAERLRELLNYDPETGVFTWRLADGRLVTGGDVAGTRHSRGYIVISVGGRRYFAHRLAWLYVTGAWPTHHIDHVNGVAHDNRIANLREATPAQNTRNGKLHRDNKSGLKGVSRAGNHWRATIGIGRRTVHLGCFKTPEAAHAAYCVAARKHHGEFHRKA